MVLDLGVEDFTKDSDRRRWERTGNLAGQLAGDGAGDGATADEIAPNDRNPDRSSDALDVQVIQAKLDSEPGSGDEDGPAKAEGVGVRGGGDDLEENLVLLDWNEWDFGHVGRIPRLLAVSNLSSIKCEINLEVFDWIEEGWLAVRPAWCRTECRKSKAALHSPRKKKVVVSARFLKPARNSTRLAHREANLKIK